MSEVKQLPMTETHLQCQLIYRVGLCPEYSMYMYVIYLSDVHAVKIVFPSCRYSELILFY